jgi:hypothetical protein
MTLWADFDRRKREGKLEVLAWVSFPFLLILDDDLFLYSLCNGLEYDGLNNDRRADNAASRHEWGSIQIASC